MRLATAIRMGSLLIDKPFGGDSRTCAIGMGLIACGKRCAEEDMNYSAILEQWPWLGEVKSYCPSCGSAVREWRALYHVFDAHVAVPERDWYSKYPRLTIEQLCDFIDSIDPTPRDSQESVETTQEVNTEKVTA